MANGPLIHGFLSPQTFPTLAAYEYGSRWRIRVHFTVNLFSGAAIKPSKCYYPKPYRSWFCLLKWLWLMYSSPQDSFALLDEPLHHLTCSGSWPGASETQRAAPRGCRGKYQHQSWHRHPGPQTPCAWATHHFSLSPYIPSLHRVCKSNTSDVKAVRYSELTLHLWKIWSRFLPLL